VQPNETYSVPRRQLDVEDYIDIARRHKGWIFGPFLFAVVATVVVAYLWPDVYVSSANVKIVPQQVQENMMEHAVNQQMFDRINSMEQTILSRTTLTTIINNLDLYRRDRSRMPLEDVIDEMRKAVDIVFIQPPGTSRQLPAFKVEFRYEDRYKAQQVVTDLAGRFISENTRSRSEATFETTQFMKDELDRAQKQLNEVEEKLATFQIANNGRLPDQADANLRQLATLQAQVTILDSQMSRASQEKLQMEANLRIYKDQLAALQKEPREVTVVPPPQRNEALAEAEREVQGLDNQMAVLRQHYTDANPDVQMAAAHLAVAKQKRDAILKEESSKKPEPSVTQPVRPETVREIRDLDATVQRGQNQIEAKELEVEQYAKEMKRANEKAKGFQGLLETVPLGQKQYGELLRDREIAKLKYVELQEKLSRAQTAQEMEVRKQGETLDLLDPASLPITPTEPKRPLLISIGAGLGLILGFVIAGAREMKDTSLKNLKDVRAYTAMAILGSIPLLENDFVVRRRKRLAWLGWTVACLAAAVIVSGSIVYYYVTKV
jgi:polysaccharide chain length determinant protein (PEP-CTERM system associated)